MLGIIFYLDIYNITPEMPRGFVFYKIAFSKDIKNSKLEF